LQPGHVDYLLRVASDVWNAVEDRSQPDHVESLDAPSLQKLPGLPGQNRPGLVHHGFQLAHQLALGDWATLGELGGSVSTIRCTAQAGDDPLPHVAAQVQEQVGEDTGFEEGFVLFASTRKMTGLTA